MKFWRLLVVVVALVSAPSTAQDRQRVATVLGQDITRLELASATDESSRTLQLLGLIWRRVATHYVAQHGLAATPAEVAEVVAYDREFRRKDRAQRARKLAELDQRLDADGLSPERRAHLEDFRATLRRLARYDAEQDNAPQPAAASQQASFAPWIEAWKLNQALYERFGGVVALTYVGHSPQGAHAAVIADYEARGLIRFFDPALRERVHARLLARPAMVVPPEKVDFTPIWKLSIPPSYFPD